MNNRIAQMSASIENENMWEDISKPRFNGAGTDTITVRVGKNKCGTYSIDVLGAMGWSDETHVRVMRNRLNPTIWRVVECEKTDGHKLTTTASKSRAYFSFTSKQKVGNELGRSIIVDFDLVSAALIVDLNKLN